MKFRPCIDLHNGEVVQIVGGSLNDNDQSNVQTNFRSAKSPAEFASLYRRDSLSGGHVIALGKGNEDAALTALSAYPGGMQYGGGVNPDNAALYLDAGASHVIVTSYVFAEGQINFPKLEKLLKSVGKEKLVLDLSCRKKDSDFFVVTDRWQTFTHEKVNPELLNKLAQYCSEFLVHGVDVEGLQQGIQEELIALLGQHSPCPVTYAGGVSKLSDLDLVARQGRNKVDLTIGSALDIFGGKIPYSAVLDWQRDHLAGH